MCKTTKNFCKSKGEPISICTYYECKDGIECEYFEESRGKRKVNDRPRCKHYFNGSVCKCQDAQDAGRKD